MTKNRSSDRSFAVFGVCLLGLLLLLFYSSLDPSKVLSSNDGPLGALNQKAFRLPAGFTGQWYDQNSVGTSGGSALTDPTQLFLWLVGPLGFAKFAAPFALLVLGLGAWFFFRQLKLAPLACLLGGLAAILNSDFFSVPCWGVVQQAVCFGMNFLALGLISMELPRWSWVKYPLAGFAVGLGVMEGADIGSLFSLVTAAYVVYSALVAEGSLPGRVARGVGSLACVGAFAAFIAAQALNVHISVDVKGVAGTQQDKQTKAERWDFATQWSLPKEEALGLLVPGLFGFRMDTPEGGSYWGAVGRVPAFDRYFCGGPVRPGDVVKMDSPSDPRFDTVKQVDAQGNLAVPPAGEVKAAGLTTAEIQKEIAGRLRSKGAPGDIKVVLELPPGSMGAMRQSGGGFYAGVLVVLVVFWTGCQALRREGPVFTLLQRKLLWFWMGTMVVALLLAFGRFAPFYRGFYALPYASAIRNPAKFIHIFTFALLVLFAYGIDGWWRMYLQPAGAGGRWSAWWSKASRFDKRWVLGCAAFLGLSVVGWVAYGSSKPALEQFLERAQVGDAPAAIAAFSVRQVGLFVLLFALGAGLLLLILRGTFGGARARWGGLLLGLFLVADFVWPGGADQPWILYWDYKDKYETETPNQLIEMFRKAPYEHRVAILPKWPFEALQMPPEVLSAEGFLSSFYGILWSQHHFLYYDIQSLDIVQMPRMPENLKAFEMNFQFNPVAKDWHKIARRWQLTNTRYLLGLAGYVDLLNGQLDPVHHSFRVAARFDLGPKPGVVRPARYEDYTAVLKPDGQYAVIEYTGALPRAGLYANWQVNTNDAAALEQLASPSFEPEKTVLVAVGLPAPAAPAATNQTPGTVEFAQYSPTDIVLKANATGPAVLLLNDKFDSDWKVLVDGKPESLLRCNFLMRGVYLNPGPHRVEFSFQPPLKPMYISLAAMVVGLGLVGLLVLAPRGGGDQFQTPNTKHQTRSTKLQAAGVVRAG